MGDHTETLQVDFDPAILSFSQILDLFWGSHNPHAAHRRSQYMSALFWHDAEQRGVAEASAARIEESQGAKVTTQILAFDRFYLAEDYHQKYVLRRHAEFASALLVTYPLLEAFVASTAAARLNGYLAGHGSRHAMAQDLPLLGLGADEQVRLTSIHHG